MTKEEMITDLENNIKEVEKFLDNAKSSFIGPEKLVDITPKPIDFKIKETWIELNPVEWEYISRIYL